MLRTLGRVSAAPDTAIRLEGRFAHELPEMAVRWQAEPAPDARLLVLNEPLAADLGLDIEWLRSPDGLRFLVGNELPDGATPVADVLDRHPVALLVPEDGAGAL